MDPSSESPESRFFAKEPIADSARSSPNPNAEAFSARPLGKRAPRVVEGVRLVPDDGDSEKELPRVAALGSTDPAQEAGLTEFVVYAEEVDTGKPWPLFIVPAADKETVYRLCHRRYLTITAVEPYEPAPYEVKPPVCPWGPPASGRKFEREYHNRRPERETPRDTAGGGGGLSPWMTVVIIVVAIRVLIALLRSFL